MKFNRLIVSAACAVVSMMLLSGCGEGGADKTAAVAANAEADNRAEAVSGFGEAETAPAETSGEETTPAVQENKLRLDAEDVGQFNSAVEALENKLEEKGVRLGFDAKRKAIVAIGHCECSVTNVLDMLDESRRFEITEGAFLNALATIATALRQEFGADGSFGTSGDAALKSDVSQKLKGLRILMQTETLAHSNKGEGWVYGVALAVAWSEKLAQTAEAAMAGRMEDIPRGFTTVCSLEDWMQRDQDLLSMLGVRLLFDAPDHFWILGIAAQDDGEDSEDDSSVAHARAAYMAECALGGFLKHEQVVKRSLKDMPSGAKSKGDGSSGLNVANHRLSTKVIERSFEEVETIEMKPFLSIPPHAAGIRWFEQRVKHPMTGRSVKLAIAAIPSEKVRDFMERNVSR